jgi:hypothetical protein
MGVVVVLPLVVGTEEEEGEDCAEIRVERRGVIEAIDLTLP